MSKKWELSGQVDKEFEWRKWMKEIPYLNFPEHVKIKIIPPFNGAIIRFQLQHKEYEDTWLSVYLDCYDILGCVGEPYWEVYPYIDGDVYRCSMNNTKDLLHTIEVCLKHQIKTNIENKVKDLESKFYTYSQNNSHGYFIKNDNVCECVIIEAKSDEHANSRAEEIGIYFDGIDKGEDCSCCGDRWDRACNDGTVKPMIYDKPIKEIEKSSYRKECIIYYLNGVKEKVNF